MTPDRATELGREGMVTVFDHEGGYLGCMGRERWQRLLDQDASDKATELRRAVRAYFRACDDRSWSTEKDWHKRHDRQKAEHKLREMVGMEKKP